MNALHFLRFPATRTGTTLVGAILLTGAVVGLPSTSTAQAPMPSATPIATVAPTATPDVSPTPLPTAAPSASPGGSPTPAPSASPSATPGTVVTPGFVDLTAYKQLRTPSATVTLMATAAASNVSARSGATKLGRKSHASAQIASPIAVLQPVPGGGVFTAVDLGPLSGTAPPPSAAVSLQFDSSWATSLVWVQTLDGGTLQATGSDGQPVTAPNGFWMQADATGLIAFTFQAPTAIGRYQILIRIDNVSNVLPFMVPDPNAYN